MQSILINLKKKDDKLYEIEKLQQKENFQKTDKKTTLSTSWNMRM